jgi:hypothetical protein
MLPPPSGSKKKPSNRIAGRRKQAHSGFLFVLLLDRKDKGNIFLRNVRCVSKDQMPLYPRTQNCLFYCHKLAQSVSRQQLGKHVPTCNSGRCVSMDEYYSLLLGNSQRANELARWESHDLCFRCCPCGACMTKTCFSLDECNLVKS